MDPAQAPATPGSAGYLVPMSHMPAIRRWMVAATLPTAAVIACAVGDERRSGVPHLQLDEIATWTLPDSFELGGASVSPAGSTVLWAVNQPYLIVEHRGMRRTVRSSALARPVAVALVRNDSLLEVVDAERHSLLRLTLSGDLVAEQPVKLPWRVDSATRSDARWVLAGRDTAGGHHVIAVGPTGIQTPLLTLPRDQPESVRLPMHLSDAGESVLATLTGPPHRVTRVSVSRAGSGRVVSSAEFTVPALRTASSGGEPPLWVSLGIHPLDDGFIRTMSDLRGDERVLVTYDRDGRLLRHSVVAVPMAVMTTVPGRRLLLAARRTDRLELVKYRWRWVGGNP